MASRLGAQHATNILGALSAASRPLSAYDLLDRLRPTGVAAPLTVYRALNKLIASGKVHRIESLNAFVACRTGEHHQHQCEAGETSSGPRSVGFAICDQCGQVEEFVEDKLFAQLHRGIAKRGFKPAMTAVEVHGQCSACSATG